LLPAAQHRLIRGLALIHAGLTLALSWSLLAQFDCGTAAMPDAAQQWSTGVIALGLAGMLYGALLAFRQNDLRRLLAFAVISQIDKPDNTICCGKD